MQSFMGESLIDKLRQALPQLGTSHMALREAAHEVFLQHPHEASTVLLAALQKKVKPIGKIALLLGAMQIREAVQVLADISLSQDLAELECAEIVCALAELIDGQDAFNENLMAILKQLESHSSSLVRGMLANVYAKVGDLVSLDRLGQLSKDSDSFVREKAKQALLQLGPVASQEESNVCEQIEALSHLSQIVQACAVAALKKQGHPSAIMPLFVFIHSASVMKDKKLRAKALGALANCLTGAEQGLLESFLLLAKDVDPEVHAAALLCLGRVSDIQGKSLQPIILGLLALDKNINASAAIALSEGFRAEHEHLLKFLVEIYSYPNLSVSSREALLIAFSRVSIADAQLRDRLRYLLASELKSKVLNIRKTAIVVLDGLYDDKHPVPAEVAKLLQDSLFDRNKEIQIVSASFLAKHGLR